VGFAQEGMWAPGAVTVRVDAGSGWVERSATVNRRTGEVRIAAGDMPAGSGAVSVWASGTVMDRRRAMRAAHVNLMPAALGAMDTLRVVPGTGGGGVGGFVTFNEADCMEAYGLETDPLDITTWKENHVGNGLGEAAIPTGVVAMSSMLIKPTLNESRVEWSIPALPITLDGPMVAVPDGATVVSATLVYKMDTVTETQRDYAKAAGDLETVYSETVTVRTTSATLSGVVLADDENGDTIAVYVGAGVNTTAGAWAQADLTVFAQRWLTEFRRGKLRNFRIVFTAGVASGDGGGVPTVEQMTRLLPRKSYSPFQPRLLGCNTVANNDAGGAGVANPDFNNRAWTLTIRDVSYSPPAVRGLFIRLGSLPTSISGRSLVDCRPITNEQGAWRRTWPWVQPA